MNDNLSLETDDEALAWLRSIFSPGQWLKLAQAMRIAQEHGGYARVVLILHDGKVNDHPKVEISL